MGRSGAGGGGVSGAVGAGGSAGKVSGGGRADAGANGGDAGGPLQSGAGGKAGSNARGAGGSSGGAVHAGAGGTEGNAGHTSAGGAAASAGAAGEGGEASVCKRGIAANVAPGAPFSPGVGWWYNWSMTGGGSVEFVPMMWGKDSVSASIPAGADFLLTFNEPNFHAQSNLSAQAAADLWPQVEGKAKAAGIPIVSPAMNFCGPASDCNGTDPYQYLKDFFAACSSCEVDYVAVHWYNCDLPSLKDYLEPGGSLEGFEQFEKPIWLTEFSCDGSASAADQEAYMRAAVPYLEANPHVFRYSWFSADPIPNAKLVADDGSPTALGQVYLGLAGSCH